MVSRSICQPTRFGVDEVVAQLRERRESALRARQNGNGRPPLLPSRPVLAEVVNGLAAACSRTGWAGPTCVPRTSTTTWATRWTWRCPRCISRCGANCSSGQAVKRSRRRT